MFFFKLSLKDKIARDLKFAVCHHKAKKKSLSFRNMDLDNTLKLVAPDASMANVYLDNLNREIDINIKHQQQSTRKRNQPVPATTTTSRQNFSINENVDFTLASNGGPSTSSGAAGPVHRINRQISYHNNSQLNSFDDDEDDFLLKKMLKKVKPKHQQQQQRSQSFYVQEYQTTVNPLNQTNETGDIDEEDSGGAVSERQNNDHYDDENEHGDDDDETEFIQQPKHSQSSSNAGHHNHNHHHHYHHSHTHPHLYRNLTSDQSQPDMMNTNH